MKRSLLLLALAVFALGFAVPRAGERTTDASHRVAYAIVKGDLANVSSYVVDLVDSIALTDNLTDSSVPASGAGFYYLVRPDCVVGSWQTSLGAEPGRDLALP